MYNFTLAGNYDVCCNPILCLVICLLLNGSSKYQIIVHDCDVKQRDKHAPISNFITKYMHSSTDFIGSSKKKLIRTKQHLTP